MLLRNKDKFDQKMRSLEGEFLKASKEFCKVYSQAKAEAKNYLGKDFSEDDFPQDIASKYSYELNRSPIAIGKDFRVDLMGEEMEEMRKKREAAHKNARRAALEKKYASDFKNGTLNLTEEAFDTMDEDEIKYLVEAYNKSQGMVVGSDNYNDRLKINVKQRKNKKTAR